MKNASVKNTLLDPLFRKSLKDTTAPTQDSPINLASSSVYQWVKAPNAKDHNSAQPTLKPSPTTYTIQKQAKNFSNQRLVAHPNPFKDKQLEQVKKQVIISTANLERTALAKEANKLRAKFSISKEQTQFLLLLKQTKSYKKRNQKHSNRFLSGLIVIETGRFLV